MKNTKCIIKLVYISLAIISVAMFAGGFFVDETWQNILFSFSINIITSLLLVWFVDYNIDKRNQEQALQNDIALEKLHIINSHRLVTTLITIYTLHFNQLTIPVDNRTKNHTYLPIDSTKLNKSFSIPDLSDMFTLNITAYGTFSDTVLEAYNISLKMLLDSFTNMNSVCTFKYNSNIGDSIVDIINICKEPNGIDTLIQYQRNPIVTKPILSVMKEYTGNPIEDYETDKYLGNLFINPLMLYLHLNNMKTALEKYDTEIKKLLNN